MRPFTSSNSDLIQTAEYACLVKLEERLLLEKVERAQRGGAWLFDLRMLATLGHQVSFFSRNMRARHLEVAIGSGRLFRLVQLWRRVSRAGRVHTTGVDCAASQVAEASKRLCNASDVCVLRADVATLSFSNESFDSANLANALHCLPDVDAALAEVHRVLKPGGTLALNALLTPSEGWAPLRWFAGRLNAWARVMGVLTFVFTEAHVRWRVQAAGFRIVSAVRSGNTLDVVAVKPSTLN